MTTQYPLTLAAAALTVALAAPHAVAAVAVGDVLGVKVGEIATALEAQGYDIEEIEREDDEISVEAMLDGVEYEIEISPETGAVTEIEPDGD